VRKKAHRTQPYREDSNTISLSQTHTSKVYITALGNNRADIFH